MPVNIYLDDVRSMPFGFDIHVRNYKDCIYWLSRNDSICTLSLDHDLGEDKTGYDVICWIEEQCYNNKFVLPYEILIHSANPVGRANIQRVIDRLYGNP